MPNDLENSLIYGGVSPAAAKIIANAISNASTSQLDIGRRYGDATPVEQLRLVTPETRKYLLTNLDQPRDGRFSRDSSRSGQYQPRDTSHTYDGSQPAAAQPTLTTPSVTEGDYITAKQAATNSVAQAQVGLRVTQKGGTHARFNAATKAVEAVPFSVECDQEQFVEAAFEERPEGTVLKIRFKKFQQFVDVNGNTFWGWANG